MITRSTIALVFATAALVTGCADERTPDRAGDGSRSDASTTERRTPGDQDPPSWRPTEPSTRVEPGDVASAYGDAVDAAASAFPAELTWADAQASIETFAGVCVVKVERVGTGPAATDPDRVRQATASAVAPYGFDDLALQDDPGGALTFVARDDRDALLEVRSATQTTVAVRVAAAAAQCGE